MARSIPKFLSLLVDKELNFFIRLCVCNLELELSLLKLNSLILKPVDSELSVNWFSMAGDLQGGPW